MGASVKVVVLDRELRWKLQALSRVRLGRALDDVGQHVVSSTTERFAETSMAPDGAPWQPSQRALASGDRTLVLQGHLRDSITHDVDGDSVSVGSNLAYAAIHQYGGEAGRRGARVSIPARPFLGLSSDDEAEIKMIFHDHFEAALA